MPLRRDGCSASVSAAAGSHLCPGDAGGDRLQGLAGCRVRWGARLPHQAAVVTLSNSEFPHAPMFGEHKPRQATQTDIVSSLRLCPAASSAQQPDRPQPVGVRWLSSSRSLRSIHRGGSFQGDDQAAKLDDRSARRRGPAAAGGVCAPGTAPAPSSRDVPARPRRRFSEQSRHPAAVGRGRAARGRGAHHRAWPNFGSRRQA